MATERPFPGVWRQKATTKEKAKQQRERKWNLTINWHGERHNYSGYTDAEQTFYLRLNILKSCRWYDAGEPINTRGMPKREREILADLGIIKANGRANLHQLLDDYVQALAAEGRTKDYFDRIMNRNTQIFDACGFDKPDDIDAESVSKFLAGLDCGKQTRNHWLRSIKGFVKRLLVNGHLHTDPLVSLGMLNCDDDKRVRRRPITDEEFTALLKATQGHNKLPAASRRMVYRIARWTGFRASEIGSLTVDSFEELDASPPIITIAPTISKRRKADRQIISELFAAMLRRFLRGCEGLLFPGHWRRRASEMLRKDLEAAGIEYRDSRGRQADFHSLRHGYVTGLARAGMKPKTLQRFARHSTITLSLDVYTHLDEKEAAAELEILFSEGGR